MKIALCLAGQPRWFNTAGQYFIKSIVSKFDCDVFFHTWFDKNKIGQSYSSSSWVGSGCDHHRENTISDLYKLYTPTSFIVEPEYSHFPTPRNLEEYGTKNTTGQSANMTFSMFYSICKSLELAFVHEAKYNFKYDCVVRSRFDCAVDHETFDFSNLEENTLYSNDCIHSDSIPDYFNYGTSNTMKVFSKIHNNIDSYWNDDNVLMCGEEMLGHHLRKNKIQSVMIPATTHLVRDELFSNKKFGKTHGD